MSYYVMYHTPNDAAENVHRETLEAAREHAEELLRGGSTNVEIYKLVETVKIQAVYEPVEAQDKPKRRKRTPEAEQAPDEALRAFEELWKAYPLKAGKNHALKAYLKVRGKVPDGEILEGIVRYIRYVEDRREEGFPDLHFKDGGTWFHQQGWESEWRLDETSG